MTAIWPDDRLDDEIRRFLERRWNDVGGAPTAADVVRTMRLHDASPRAPRRPVIRVAPLLAAAAVLVLVAASVAFVGSQRRADVSIQPSTGPTTSAPAVTPQAPVAPPAAIGPISVVRAEGSWGDDIVEVPGGFAAFTDHGYLESSDGTTWRQVVPPVPGDGPFEHVAGESEHWIWSQAARLRDMDRGRPRLPRDPIARGGAASPRATGH
jgi:hypothetical protein